MLTIISDEWRRLRRTIGLNGKNPPEIEFKNLWNWQIILMPAKVSFDKFWIFSVAHVMTGNGNYVNRLKAWKNSWNHIKWTYFRHVLAIGNHCETPRRSDFRMTYLSACNSSVFFLEKIREIEAGDALLQRYRLLAVIVKIHFLLTVKRSQLSPQH